MFGGITVFLRKKNIYYNNIIYVSFVIIPLCNNTFLSKTVYVSETYLEASLWKPFQLFGGIPENVSTMTNASSL